jgi:elongation factor Ts
MMECRSALDEAGGDYERAKEILREKGQAAAAKRSDRSTSEGIVAIATADTAIAGVIVQCETDFVSTNSDFKALVAEVANIVLDTGAAGLSLEDALELTNDAGTSIKGLLEEAVGKIRENIQLAKVVKMSGGSYGYYVHHDNKKGAIVELNSGNDEVGKYVSMQVVSANPPAEFLTKEELPQDRLAKELEIETERAIQEGKPAEMAAKIAQGRVNKEFVKSAVLLEQPFFRDPSKSVAEYVKESSSALTVTGFTKLAVGE